MNNTKENMLLEEEILANDELVGKIVESAETTSEPMDSEAFAEWLDQ